jgi:hypothetical protein
MASYHTWEMRGPPDPSNSYGDHRVTDDAILHYKTYTAQSMRTSSQDKETKKRNELCRYRCNCGGNARRDTQPEHMTHTSLFSSEHASLASSSSCACFYSKAATNSGSFSAACRCDSWSPANPSACESARVSGSTGEAAEMAEANSLGAAAPIG